MTTLKYPTLMDESGLERIIPICENWCDIENYWMYEYAEKFYKEAVFMIPTRLMSNCSNEAEKIAYIYIESTAQNRKYIYNPSQKLRSGYSPI